MGSELFDEHLEAATAFHAKVREQMFRAAVEKHRSSGLLSRAESPLEEAFLLWWLALDMADGQMSEHVELLPQRWVEIGTHRFRVDFSLEPANQALKPFWQPIAIELDGHQFHERTPEQVRTRDSRDRILLGAGWRVMHYSFSEFVGDPLKCVLDVMGAGVDSEVAATIKLERQADGR